MKLKPILKVMVLGLLALLALQTRAAAQINARKILPNDVLLIRVLNEPDMMAEKKVSADGKIDYFFIGEIDLNEKTVAEAQKIIRDKLDADYLVNPQVYLEVKQYALQFVTVTGQVNRPGQVPIPPDHKMDIVEAIGAAGDFNRLANKDKIELRRGEDTKRYSYDQLRKPEGKVFVQTDDVIFVFESKF
jgi:protein involved in polysaccharide export with SLBB domain